MSDHFLKQKLSQKMIDHSIIMLTTILLSLILVFASTKWGSVFTPVISFVFTFSIILLAILCAYYFLNRRGSKFASSLAMRVTQLSKFSNDLHAGSAQPIPHDHDADDLGLISQSIDKISLYLKTKSERLNITDQVFKTACEAILVSSNEGVILDVNPQLLKVTGYTREELLGKPAGVLYRTNTDHNSSVTIRDALKLEGSWRGETFFVRRDESTFPVILSVSKIIHSDGTVKGFVSIFSDVSRLKSVEEKLINLTTTDRLTQLPTYAVFANQIEERVAQLHTSNTLFLFVLINIDRLRSINDRYGPASGDQVISQVGEYLNSVMLKGSLLCRRSGDEFIALIAIDQPIFIDQIKASLHHIICKAPVSMNQEMFDQSLSAGGVVFPHEAKSLNELLVAADAALQVSKEFGRARLTWYSEDLGKVVMRRRYLEDSLTRAINDGRVIPFYQPEVDMRTGQIIGFEALARWTDDSLGSISPAEFIPIAEDARLIESLSATILQKILQDLPVIHARFPNTKVAFNASPQLFKDQLLIDLLTKDLQTHPQILAGLEIEVTESNAAESAAEIFGQLKSIRTLGIEVAIDDFGTGYSSFSRLASMPINRLKIDAGFIAGLGDKTQTKIIYSIISLAKTLDLEVTAEGVEDQSQRDSLLAAGCHRAQGWLYSRALPIDDLLVLEEYI